MGFDITKESYAGSIRSISIGKGDKAVTVGGRTSYPFYQFEGDIPNKPKIAMEIWDMEPTDWPEAALAPFKDVVSDTAAWAKKCVEEYGADILVLQLKSTDPNDQDVSPEDSVKTVKKILGAVDVPLIIWGTGAPQKDEDVLKKISEDCEGEQLILGPVEEKNHKGIAASAMGYGHTIISSSPIDVNLAKQINILLENLGMPMDRVLIDPTTGGLGYGMEYSYSVMERLLMAAMAQGDDKLQYPIINNLGNEVWKCKEAKQTVEEAPELGDPEKRGILMEAVGAVSYLVSGGDVLIMRHPEAIRLTKAFIDCICDGGTAGSVDPISKLMAEVDVDFAALAAKPDLTIEEEKKPAAKKAAPKKAAAAKKAAPKKAVAKKAAPKKAAAKKAAPVAAAPVVDEAAAQAQAAANAKAQAEADAKAKADAEAKAKADAAAVAQAKKDNAEKAEADAHEKREQEAAELRLKREKAKADSQVKRAEATSKSKAAMTANADQKDMLGKILYSLDRIHKRV
ncbi:MAG: acetyl-CoA decarbonylase/synthase complex subunit delta [Desulfobacterales bacterium]|nr:acetyl-CoA decarbonylase/synthase complex subunit delta [Desulfobacterales bacterium]